MFCCCLFPLLSFGWFRPKPRKCEEKRKIRKASAWQPKSCMDEHRNPNDKSWLKQNKINWLPKVCGFKFLTNLGHNATSQVDYLELIPIWIKITAEWLNTKRSASPWHVQCSLCPSSSAFAMWNSLTSITISAYGSGCSLLGGPRPTDGTSESSSRLISGGR